MPHLCVLVGSRKQEIQETKMRSILADKSTLNNSAGTACNYLYTSNQLSVSTGVCLRIDTVPRRISLCLLVHHKLAAETSVHSS